MSDILGIKWIDLNGNGVFDTDEPTLPGVTIYLDLNENEVLDTDEPNTVTDEAGQYEFIGLQAGTYIVREVVPDGFVQTFPTGGGGTVGDGFADVVLEYFDSGAGPIPGPYGFTTTSSAIEPVSLDVVLGDDSGNRDFLSLPTDSFVTVGFTDEVGIDGPGDDIFVLEEGSAGDRADIFVSSNLTDFIFIGTGNGGTTSSFDLADIGFTEQVRAVKIVGLDNAGTAPGFDVVNVQVLPESVGEATGAHTVTLAEDQVVEGLNFGNFAPRPDGVANSLSDPTDMGFLIGTQIFRDSIGGADLYDFFRFELLGNSGFDLEFSGLNASAEVALLDSSGLVIERTTANNSIDGLINNELEPGVYYIRILRFDADSTPYSLEVTGTPIPQPFQILDVSPDSGSSAGQTTVTISGNQFTPEANVSLIDEAGTERAATEVIWLDSETLSATLDLTDLPVDFYDIRVTDAPGTDIAEDAFEVNVGAVGQVEVYLSSPRRIRPFGSDEVTVTYRNVGETDVIAPLLSLEVEGALFRAPGEEDFAETEVQFLGINDEGLAGILPAGVSGSFTVSFEPTGEAGNDINFSVRVAAEDELVDWDALKEDARPDFIPVEAWDAIYDNFTASVGNTAGEYQAVLVENANYLSQLGEYRAEADSLLTFEFQQASSYQDLSQYYSLGSLGRGWVFPGDIAAVTDGDGNITIQGSGTPRVFRLQEDGTYLASVGDNATLTDSADGLQLREEDGTVITFLPNGRLDSIEDTNGNQLTAVYTDGVLTSLVGDEGSSLTFIYNDQGRIASITDQAGRTTTYSYDATGELLLSVTTPEGTTNYTYDSQFALTSLTSPDGIQSEFEYDDGGRLRQVALNGGTETLSYAYDSTGGVTLTDATGATTRLLLNERGQIAQFQDALGRLLQFRYDESGNPTRIIRPNNTTTALIYDERGNVISEINPLGQRIEFTYEQNFNQLQSITDARGNAIGYDYDDRGNLISITYADASSESFSYNDRGRPIESVNRRGQAIVYTYDDRDRLIRQDNADSSFVEYNYDTRDNVTSIANNQGTTTLVYDEADRPTQITYPTGRSLSFTYDEVGRRTQIVDQDGVTVNYGYNPAGRLAQVSDGDGELTVAYSYDDAGRVVREDNGNGTYTTYEYDAAGQLINLVNYDSDDSINSSFAYSYDDLGRPVEVTTLDGTWTYGYDATDQLIRAIFNSSNPEIADQDLTYVYDSAGNRVRSIENGVTAEYVTNDLNQYTSVGEVTYEYDVDGNLISQVDSEGTTTYTYDNENRLVSVINPDGSEIEYEYDVFGNRTATIDDGERSEYLIDPFGFGNVWAEYDASGNLIARYTHGLGLEHSTDASNTTSYYDFNATGSTVGITGVDGNYLNRYSYLPFGESIFETETITNPFEYVGQFGVMEDPSGLEFMRARYYHSTLGRFTSVDPLGLQGGETNFYSYAGNSPIVAVDPEGEILQILGFVGLGALVGVGSYAVSTRLTDGDFSAGGFAGAIVSGGVAAGVIAAAGGAAAVALPAVAILGAATSALGYETQILVDGLLNGGDFSKFSLTDLAIESAFGAIPGIDTFRPQAVTDILEKSVLKKIGTEFLEKTFDKLFQDVILNKQGVKDLARQLFDQLKNELGELTDELLDQLEDLLEELANAATDIVASFDPNDIIGPAGFGAEGWITTPQVLPYTIRFENIGDISAVLVNITHQLDSDVDLDTFELGDFGFGDLVIDVPEGFQNYSERLDLRDTIGTFVDFEAGIDPETGIATWTLTTIDPETGELATGIDDGFLPPNMDGDGEGFVRYRVEPNEGLPTGAVIDAQAEIVFDTNEPINTPPIFNTIDIGDPSSTVEALPETSTSANFPVSWSGTDDGSGVASYDIFVSVDGGEFDLWLDNTTETSVLYPGEDDRTYGFYSVATDNVGHIEETPTEAQATTTVVTATQPLPPPQDATLIRGTPGNDNLIGTADNNIILGFEGNDFLNGVSGDNTFIAGPGDDTLTGGIGNDTLYGSSDDDLIDGRAGDDLLIGDSGRDILLGGQGSDTFVLPTEGVTNRAFADVLVDFTVGQDRIGLMGGLSENDLIMLQARGTNTMIKLAESDEILGIVSKVMPSELEGSFVPINIDLF